METLNKIKEKLKQTNAFKLSSIKYRENGRVLAWLYPNYLIAEPLTPKSAQELRSNAYNRLLVSPHKIYAIYYFPLSVEKSVRDKNMTSPKFTLKYITRFKNLMDAKNNGNVRLSIGLELEPSEWLKLKYVAKPYDKSKSDFKDDKADTTCKKLAKKQLPYQEIKRVSLNYNTLLILQCASKNANKSLFYYLEKGTNTFYNDCIINYILEHSNLLNPENVLFPNTPKEVRLSAKELFKLYPHKTFKFEAPEGVEITYIKHPNAKRLSKNDTIIFNFSDDFLDKYFSIITKSETNKENSLSFIRVPIFFTLQALKNNNLTSNGFKFLLWFLAFYRITKTPKIFHSLRTILTETGMDLKHGLKKPLSTLNKYFEYLFSVNVFCDVNEPIRFTQKDIDYPPKYKGEFLRLKKPKIKQS